MTDLRINEIRQTGGLGNLDYRDWKNPGSRLVGTVSNCAVSIHALMWCGWKSQLPGWTAFGAV